MLIIRNALSYLYQHGISSTIYRAYDALVYQIVLLLGFTKTRDMLAYHLCGDGVEIGALHGGMRLDPKIARVKYIDILPLEGLLARYPELHGMDIQIPDYVGTFEDLSIIPSSSQDFFIANHVLEHIRDPLQGLIEAYRVLRDDGILFLTLPDKRRTFDHHRFITPIDHFEADHFHPSESMDFIHFMESASTTYSDSYIDQLTLAKEQFIEKYPIHYHTFVMENALGLLNLGHQHGLFAFDVIDKRETSKWTYDIEFTLVLKKNPIPDHA